MFERGLRTICVYSVILVIYGFILLILSQFGVSGVENPDLPVFLYKSGPVYFPLKGEGCHGALQVLHLRPTKIVKELALQAQEVASSRHAQGIASF